VPAGSPVKFSLNTRDLRGVNILRGEFFWNMGDGTERYFAKNEKFEHIYDHEGTYTVYLKYYKTYFEGMEPDIVDKITITISNPSVSISKIHSDGSVEIKNNSSQEVDLSLWTLKDGFGKIFTVPEGTYIAGSKTLVLNSKRINLNPGNIVLLAPSGSFVGNKILIDETASLSQKVSLSSSRSTIYALGDEDGEVLGQNDEKEESINLNDRLGSDKKLETKQKQQSVWIVVFVFMVLISCAVVFFIYRNKKEEEIIEEDEFQLID
jgi:cbb3-type cytochrome oxidase subunit 3